MDRISQLFEYSVYFARLCLGFLARADGSGRAGPRFSIKLSVSALRTSWRFALSYCLDIHAVAMAERHKLTHVY